MTKKPIWEKLLGPEKQPDLGNEEREAEVKLLRDWRKVAEPGESAYVEFHGPQSTPRLVTFGNADHRG